MRHSLTHHVCVFLMLCGLAPLASAQVVENDLRLVADQSGAPPNVMILFDTSGSMNHILWQEDFNPKVRYSNGASCSSSTVSTKSGTSGQCPGSGITGDACPDNDSNWRTSGNYVRCKASSFSNGCAGWSFSDSTFTGESCSIDEEDDYIYFRLPSLNSVETWWSRNYLNYLIDYLKDNGSLPPNMPDERRIDGGKRVIEELIENINPDDDSTLGYNERVRFGIARLDGDDFQGGYVVQEITDGNKDAVISSLGSLPASGSTPVSEAFVDVARYFVGNIDLLGDYPVYDRRKTDGESDAAAAPGSPIETDILCRGNFVIVISDGEPQNDDHGHYETEFEETFGGEATSDALSVVSEYLFENDLIDDTLMPGKQNIVTYTIGFSLDTPLLRQTAINGDGAYFSVKNSDELAETLTAAVEDIILRNATFTAASVPTSRSVFGDAFYTAYFEPRPLGELYRGHLQAYLIDENFDIIDKNGDNALDPATGEFLDSAVPYWDAADTLADPTNVRNLYFTSSGTRTALEPANLSAADLDVSAADLLLYPNDPAVPFANAESLADAIVNYVKGQDAFDFDRDADTTELRDYVLGDIFHSNPQLVGQAPLLLAAEEGYGPIGDPTSFLELYAKRDKVLYAGANDGMLHAFGAGVFKDGDNSATPNITEAGYYSLDDPSDGVERFGYVPGFLVPTLKDMPQDDGKPYYVDGQITVADAWYPSSSSDVDKDTNEWATSLVVGMRNGGRGYLALDVTNPDATLATQAHGPYPKLLWEFNDASEPLGRSWSKAVITRVKLEGSFTEDHCGTEDGDGADGTVSGNCRERWVAIFAGGYLEQGDPNIADQFISDPTDPDWEDASKAIFIVAMDTGEVLARAAYDETDSELSNMTFSFPSEPAVLDIDFDGFADLVYVGDLGGQMWKWDISEVGEVSSTTGLVPLTTWPVGRFFTTPVASNGHRRNFFFPPSASLVNGKLVLAFGTGERTRLDYETTTGVDENHFYVVRDDTPTGAGAFLDLPYDISDVTALTDLATDPNPNDQGFYLVGNEDEKFVSDSIVFGGFVITASYTPDLGAATTSGGECEARGDATLYIFTIAEGEGYFDNADPDMTRRLVVGSGLPTSPSITVVSGNMSKVVLQTSDGRVIKLDGPASSVNPVDIVYWRQTQ